jgi:hypothetical protein
MVGDMVSRDLRGAAYGLRQALDTVGAFAGPLIAIALMVTLHEAVSAKEPLWPFARLPGIIAHLGL